MYDAVAEADLGRRIAGALRLIYALAFRLTNDVERAKDLVQSCAVVALEKRDQLRDAALLVPWMRRICVNLFLQEERRAAGVALLSIEAVMALEEEGSRLEIPDSRPQPSELAEVDESVREIRDLCFAAMVHRLTLHQRVVFALVETFGLSIAEASQAIELSVSATKALLGRARRHVIGYFETTCGLMAKGNPCECLIWKNILNDRILLREEARRRGIEADFSGESPTASEGSRNRDRILAMFRQLPPRRPDASWFERMLSLIKA